jgi:hypothetical protein
VNLVEKAIKKSEDKPLESAKIQKTGISFRPELLEALDNYAAE